MSERGSFVTQYIYNNDDRCTARQYLENVEHCCLKNGDLKILTEKGCGVIAGLVFATPGFPGEEIFIMEFDILPGLSKIIQHEMRVVVMADNGDTAIFALDGNGNVRTKPAYIGFG